MATQNYQFDLNHLLFGDYPPIFMAEIAGRTVIIFLYTLLLIRWMGKRGMGNLTPFEFAIIVALGSAVGDPMFQADVPLLHCMLVITLVIGLQRGLAAFSAHNEWAERALSSTPSILVIDGVIQVNNLQKESFTREELLEELRLKGIEQLGDVRIAYLEPSGELSVMRREEPREGLSAEPLAGEDCPSPGREGRECCCGYCGQLSGENGGTGTCKNCGRQEWKTVVAAFITER
ncbi:DUF421 domain-containing protein [Aeoliella sp. SH292]|uniref:DUF421 domain-containing protein n=1 Tax=Aeoliella sp. SH292 TaxID=3454464 RepID=UPI003F951E38